MCEIFPGCAPALLWDMCLKSLQVNSDTLLVVLEKEEGSGLGFSVAGGVDLEQKAVTVSIVCTC